MNNSGEFVSHEGRKTDLDARITQNDIRSIYDSLSRIYNVWATLTESRARTRALELAEIKDGQTILEVAVGTGLAFYQIVERNPHGRNMGIDLSPGMLSKARKRLGKLKGGNYRLELGSAFNLPFENEEIDLLLNNYMFDLIAFSQMDAILAEFRRVLKKSGKLVLVNMTKGEGFGAGIYDRVFRLSPKTMGGCRGIRLSERLTKNGFQVLSREYYQQMFFPSEVILARREAGG